MRRQLVTPSSIEDEHVVVDIYEKDADPDSDDPYASGYLVTSIVHDTGRRYEKADARESRLARHDDEIALYLSAR